MPVPGPRNQFGPEPGYRNPGNEQPTRINQWKRPGPVWWPGRSPGTMVISLRGCVLGFGQIRTFWRQSVNLISPTDDFSWTRNGLGAGGDPSAPQGVGITRALRYLTRSTYMGQGIDNTRYAALHTTVQKQNVYKTVTINSGQTRNKPTVRNRMTSFGSRVPTLNQAVVAAEGQNPGQATQS